MSHGYYEDSYNDDGYYDDYDDYQYFFKDSPILGTILQLWLLLTGLGLFMERSLLESMVQLLVRSILVRRQQRSSRFGNSGWGSWNRWNRWNNWSCGYNSWGYNNYGWKQLGLGQQLGVGATTMSSIITTVGNGNHHGHNYNNNNGNKPSLRHLLWQ